MTPVFERVVSKWVKNVAGMLFLTHWMAGMTFAMLPVNGNDDWLSVYVGFNQTIGAGNDATVDVGFILLTLVHA
ncbi:MAG: hypothetical protein U0V64_05620 [Cyclobacteriaceae bacterium]